MNTYEEKMLVNKVIYNLELYYFILGLQFIYLQWQYFKG